MRLRRYAKVQLLTAKELRLKEALRRRDLALLLSAYPTGILGALSYNQGATTITVNTPLRAIVPTAEEVLSVISPGDDTTGGYTDVTIPAGRQIAELASNAAISFAGFASGTYTIYATHTTADENPVTQAPPGQNYGGPGATQAYIDFHELTGAATGDPVPRPDYDDSLSSEIVQELVDRLTITVTSGTVPSSGVPLLSVAWNGAAFTSVTEIARTVSLANSAALEILNTLLGVDGANSGLDADYLDGQHGSYYRDANNLNAGTLPAARFNDTAHGARGGGTLHAVATTGASGFMSNADKSKLDGIAAGAQVNPTATAILTSLLGVDGVDSGLDADRLRGLRLWRAVIRIISGGEVGNDSILPAGWSVAHSDVGIYTITKGASTDPSFSAMACTVLAGVSGAVIPLHVRFNHTTDDLALIYVYDVTTGSLVNPSQAALSLVFLQ